VKHYGFEFKYGINDVDGDDPLPQGIPSECDNLLKRALQTGHVHHYPDQLTINKYLAGQGNICHKVQIRRITSIYQHIIIFPSSRLFN